MAQKLARNVNYIVLNLSKFDKTKNLKQKFFCDCNVFPCYCLSNGKFENKVGRISAKEFASYGWWEVEINGNEIFVRFFHRLEDDSIEEAINMGYDKSKGWQKVK